MAEISSAALREGVKEILENGDLNTLSSKRVRRSLEDKFCADLTDRKQEIDDMLMSMITGKESVKAIEERKEASSSKTSTEENCNKDHHHRESDSSSFSEVEDEPPVKRKKSISKQEIQPKAEKFRSRKTDKKTDKWKSAQLVDESDSEIDDQPSQTLNDEELARQLQQEEDGGRRTRNRIVKKPTTATTTQKKKKERKGKSGYSAEMVLSPELAEIMGTDRMARHDVVKRMWEIIRERELMDPKNKQFMLCDDQLFRVFGKKRIRTFGMMKYLKTHIKDPVYLADN
ncbi:uncharacterized protein [Ptychodera flava]|uniref:uncharacterized protein n=1 Tax=Ptychodera flava TaxID=63121 RepID=UPI003969E38B